MDHTLEHAFETEICEYLGNSDYKYNPTSRDAGFDPHLALFPEDVIYWLSTQYPKEYAKVCPPDLTGPAREAKQHRLLEYLAKRLNTTPKNNRTSGGTVGGLLGTLRNGFDYFTGNATAKFGSMAEYYPTNPSYHWVTEKAKANRFRIIRQVHFDTTKGNNETIDLVILLNGIPIATLELKTDNTQTIENAVTQYKKDRKPHRNRPLLAPGRCLVHFAVSNTEVRMATKLAGDKTYFLPFNQGNGEHAGNPQCTDGSDTSYLWRDVLQPQSLLHILDNYAMYEPGSAGNGHLIFPRFHQRRAVEAIINDIQTRGAGKRYLIQHSAGSGKTKTIAWLAHRLVRHYMPTATKTFDSVIVVTDRQALDRNLAEEIVLLPASTGLVQNVDAKSTGSKSSQLKQALESGGHIITCTVQTFPVVQRLLKNDKQLANKKWCVIIDEAHSSQTGAASVALRELLGASLGTTADQLTDNEDTDAEVTNQLDQQISRWDAALAESHNVTFVALTATPKPKTLRTFGTEGPDGGYHAFDHYTMSQAIEEGFILDVLTNYTTYSNFIEIADHMKRDEVVDKGEVVNEIVRYSREHPTNIAQKVAVVANHFRENVKPLLGGQARAMVVTASRESAFHWCTEMIKYLHRQSWDTEFDVLIAFSGKLESPQLPRVPHESESTIELVTQARLDRQLTNDMLEGRATFDGDYTEVSYNKIPDVETAFKDEDSLNRILIVASKFQTGFNEPKLCAMYVDKKLSGVATVQTLSRLNRIYPGKTSPMIVDFVNDAESVLKDFQRFYADASMPGDVEPSALFEVAERIDTAGFYTEEDIDRVAAATLGIGEKASHEKSRACISAIVRRWNEGLTQARKTGDDDEKERHLIFRSDLKTYLKSWEFLSQIINFGDPTLRKRAILAQQVSRNLTPDIRSSVDVSSVDILGVAVTPTMIEQNLGLIDGDGQVAIPILGGGIAAPDSPIGIAFNEAVDEANTILAAAGISMSNEATKGFLAQFHGTIRQNDRVKKLAKNNTAEQLQSAPTFKEQVAKTLLEVSKTNREAFDLLFTDADSMSKFVRIAAQVLHLDVNA